MIPTQLYYSQALPPPQFSPMQPIQFPVPPAPPVQSHVCSFWEAANVKQHLRNLQNNIDLAKALQNELEEIQLIRQSSQNGTASSNSPMSLQIPEMLKEMRISLDTQESLSLEAAHSLISALRDQLVPFDAVTRETGPWDQRSMAVRLAQKMQKAKRNKQWKKKKRKLVAELLHKEREGYDKADQEADEWRAREIAKDIAKRKVESMKAIAKLKAKEERKRLESELELVLVVEKLQELRSMRIQKLKKQGHFLPEEDDKFLERVRFAAEEEERQAAAAADTYAAKDAIVTAEGSRKTILDTSSDAGDLNCSRSEGSSSNQMTNEKRSERRSSMDENVENCPQKSEVSARGHDSVANLPFEFYHYYHGSSNDMGTLIEVRRTWDAYIRPGGSRIPGHWVQPPQPADEVWASYIIGHK